MVGKLIKYDFQSFFRLLFPVQLIVIGIAGLNRIVQIFENETSTYKISEPLSAGHIHTAYLVETDRFYAV